jgi:hypothetical protein
MVFDSYEYSSCSSNVSAKKSKLFEINVQEEGPYFWSVCQDSKRKFARSANYQYSPLFMTVGKVERNTITYVGACCGSDREIFKELVL